MRKYSCAQSICILLNIYIHIDVPHLKKYNPFNKRLENNVFLRVVPEKTCFSRVYRETFICRRINTDLAPNALKRFTHLIRDLFNINVK